MNMLIKTFLTEWTDNNRTTLIAEDSRGVIIGTANIDYLANKKDEAFVWNLFVDEKYRKKGVAEALLKVAEKDAQSYKCDHMALEWYLKDSPRWVFDWYVRLGYEEKEFGKDCSLLVKQLKYEENERKD